MKTIFAADLFCGAGGTSTGLLQAAASLGYDVDLVAVNHWNIAISTHSANHPTVNHKCVNLDNIDPRSAVPGGYLDLLVASPECVFHSRARGGKPVNDQRRASAWQVVHWLEILNVKNFMLENVPEFVDWGPLFDDCDCGVGVESDIKLHSKKCNWLKPIPKYKGRIFRSFLSSLRALGYHVDYRIINTADYGDPTTRKRLFVLGTKNGRVHWPEPTFSETGSDLFGDRAKWRSAREIIDWSIESKSIFERKKPLSPNTLRRIEAGLKKYGGLPFTITTNWSQTNRSAPRSINEPIAAITGQGANAVVQPFLVQLNGTSGSHIDSCAQGIDEPAPTITGTLHTALIEPVIIPVNHGEGDLRSYSIDSPMPTITAFDALAIAEPFLVEYHGGDEGKERVKPLDIPIPTLDTQNRFGLVKPYLVEYYGNGSAQSIDDPLQTVTGNDHFGLVQPRILQSPDGTRYMLDIKFRMLQPNELAAAMSFPKDYVFSGNRGEVVKQIGNAVPVKTAAALCAALLQ